jgi:hypothetical protein
MNAHYLFFRRPFFPSSVTFYVHDKRTYQYTWTFCAHKLIKFTKISKKIHNYSFNPNQSIYKISGSNY